MSPAASVGKLKTNTFLPMIKVILTSHWSC